VALLAHGALAAGPKSAQIVARIGPWPVVSNLIAFRGRIWFVNSVTGRNHNSADIYSYAPSNGALRYERHLFSQDAGRPTAGDGWLYWPFEDDRFSLGWGMFSAGAAVCKPPRITERPGTGSMITRRRIAGSAVSSISRRPASAPSPA
jgi:hypothetical protein